MNVNQVLPLSAAELNDVIEQFIRESASQNVRMILVGGGAVNFHGVQRHSADVDFWIETTEDNLARLKNAIWQMGYKIDAFPEAVFEKKQNISIHISPVFKIELITHLNFGLSFEDALKRSETTYIKGSPEAKFKVLNFEDLIESKLKSGRPKDYYDVLSLREVKEQHNPE
jgi:predicted nucleotidyltransferase component of viral defense system